MPSAPNSLLRDGWLVQLCVARALMYLSGVVLNSLVSLTSGGTYTTMIMVFADRYPPERRGTAVGW